MKKKQKVALQFSKVRPKKKKVPARVLAARRVIRKGRPLHRQAALHPITALILLCIGVLLCAHTFHALADTVSVGAVVSAPPLTTGATITSPSNGFQTSTQALTVSGTCPDSSYVDLSDNGVFVGTDACSSGAFEISLDLSSGSNQLEAQDYNFTNTPGPQSSAVTVTYTPGSTTTSSSGTASQPPTTPITKPAVKTPVATPVQLKVAQVDRTIPYIASGPTPIVSDRPTLTGIAPPYSYVLVTLKPGSHTCATYANSQGFWSCTVSTTLPAGVYTVTVTARTPQGTLLTLPSFHIQVIPASPPSLGLPQPFRITSSYLYKEEAVGSPVSFTIVIAGGRAPYAFTIEWGDSSTSTIIQQSSNNLTITHTYNRIDAALMSKVIKVQGIDASGQSATLQLDAFIRNSAYRGAAVTKSGGIENLFGKVRPWLWVIWPGYGIVVLLVLSFWLGEREELARMMSIKGARPKHHHVHH